MKHCLDKVTAILSGLGAAIAVPASAAAAGTAVTTAAVGLPLLASLGAGALLYSAIKERKKDDCKALMDSARRRVMTAWPYDDPTDRTEQAERDRLETALANVLPKCLPSEEPELRAFLAVQGLNGARIAEMLVANASAYDSTFDKPGARAFFCDVVTSAWEALRLEPNFYATLQSHVDEAMFVQLDNIRINIIEGFAETHDRIADLQSSINKLVLTQEDRAREFHIKEGMLIALARRYAEGSPKNFDAALAGLERALEVAKDEQERGRLPSNTGEAVDAVIARIDSLNEAGDLDAGQAALEAELFALNEEDEHRRAVRSRLYEKGIAQAILTRSVTNACRFVTAKFDLEVFDNVETRYTAFRALFISWCSRGRQKGLIFDLQVAVALAHEAIARTQSVEQRNAMRTNLGTALSLLGEQTGDIKYVEEGIVVYRDTIEELSRVQEPLLWAMTMNNLGTALWELGKREHDNKHLDEAMLAYRAALEERTQERVPLDWAITKYNIGNVKKALGQRESSVQNLEDAILSYRAALQEQTREYAPLDWAMTQMGIGDTLLIIGQRESGVKHLKEATLAYRAALEEQNRERAPLDWASNQQGLGNTLMLIGQREADVGKIHEAIEAYRAALEVLSRKHTPLDWGTAIINLSVSEGIVAHETKDVSLANSSVNNIENAIVVFLEYNHELFLDYSRQCLNMIKEIRDNLINK